MLEKLSNIGLWEIPERHTPVVRARSIFSLSKIASTSGDILLRTCPKEVLICRLCLERSIQSSLETALHGPLQWEQSKEG